MSKYSLKTQIVAGILIGVGVIGMFVILGMIRRAEAPTNPVVQPLTAPADGSLAARVEGFGFAPYDTMTIEVAGLDPSAATAVVFTTRTKERVVMPAFAVTTTEVRVPVPPFEYDEDKNAFAPDQVSLMVVQTKRDGSKLKVRSSNQSNYFTVTAPTPPSAVANIQGAPLPTGSVAQVVLAVAVERLKEAGTHVPTDKPELAAAVAKAQAGMADLLAGVEKIKKNPKATVRLKLADGSSVNLGINEVAVVDALYNGYFGMLERRLASAPTARGPELIAPAYASSASACVDLVMGNPNTDARLTALVEALCGVTGNDYSLFPKMEDDSWVKEQYLLQMSSSLALREANESWGIGTRVAAAAELTMFFDLAIEGKLPDGSFVKDLLISYGAEGGDVALKKLFGERAPFLADLQTAIEIWDLGCKAFSWTRCLSSREIAVGTGDIIIMDIGDRINDMLLPFFDAVLTPDYSTVADFDSLGVMKGGFAELIGPDVTIEPYLPEPVTTAGGPSPAPVNTDKIAPGPGPTPGPTPGPRPTPTPGPSPTCSDLKEATLKDCQADCPNEMTGEEYSACTSGCSSVNDLIEKNKCVNRCIGNWLDSKSVRSNCMSGCLKAYNDMSCP